MFFKSDCLVGKFLIAMPNMADPRFYKTVIYMCAHSEQGAMGIIVNKLLHQLPYADLMSQLSLSTMEGESEGDVLIHFGGPVDVERGFVLHSLDYKEESTVVIGESVGLTATSNILREIGKTTGAKKNMLTLGYAGWNPGQLDRELRRNSWLIVNADMDLIFDGNLNVKWDTAIASIGVDKTFLSNEMGHA